MAEQFKFSSISITATNSVSLIAATTAATAMVRSITLCNKSTSGTTSIDVKMYVSEKTASFFLFRYTQMTSSQTLMPLSTPVVVVAGDSLELSKSGEDVDATATYLELS